MHYKNGRAAKNGDKVVLLNSYGPPVIGILYGAVAGNDYCNGRLAPMLPSDPCPNLKDCYHLDDVLAALPTVIPDTLGPNKAKSQVQPNDEPIPERNGGGSPSGN